MKVFLCYLVIAIIQTASADVCTDAKIKVQVLGSGGPELTADRASSSYLLWLNGKAIVLIDSGGGSSLRFGQSNADWVDLEFVLFTHFHADHSSDFPALIKASWFGNRQKDLPIFGPFANHLMPSTTQYLDGLFDVDAGVFKYLSDMYDDVDAKGYKLIAHDIKDSVETQKIYNQDSILILAQKVTHGPIPSFAYVVNICGKTIVFSGDTTGAGFENLKLKETDLFIAHNAIPQHAGPIAKSLHMTPKQIGQIANNLNTKVLVISHRMNRSLGKEEQTQQQIKLNYNGQIHFADDLDSYELLQ